MVLLVTEIETVSMRVIAGGLCGRTIQQGSAAYGKVMDGLSPQWTLVTSHPPVIQRVTQEHGQRLWMPLKWVDCKSACMPVPEPPASLRGQCGRRALELGERTPLCRIHQFLSVLQINWLPFILLDTDFFFFIIFILYAGNGRVTF